MKMVPIISQHRCLQNQKFNMETQILHNSSSESRKDYSKLQNHLPKEHFVVFGHGRPLISCAIWSAF